MNLIYKDPALYDPPNERINLFGAWGRRRTSAVKEMMTTLRKPRFPCEGELFLEVIVRCDMNLFSHVGFCNFQGVGTLGARSLRSVLLMAKKKIM
jgi:hypothetical protein